MEIRYFGGMSMVEAAAVVLNVFPATVLHDRNAAKAWLYSQLNRTGSPQIPELAQ